MGVSSKDLENPERGLQLEDRGPAAVRDTAREAEEQLRRRLEAARGLGPEGRELHWLEVWRQGRDAAVGAYERGGAEAIGGAEPPEGCPCRDCWRHGYRAATRALLGGGGPTA